MSTEERWIENFGDIGGTQLPLDNISHMHN